jgi:hypothetical protein
MHFEIAEQASFDSRPRARRPVRAPTRDKLIVAHGLDSPRRKALEEFVRREFSVHFAADLREFMPQLLALQDEADDVHAVVGCRRAADAPLLVERYTRAPIEQMIARRAGAAVARADIVEIGSLACRNGRAAVEMITALVPFLIGAGFGWVAFTGAATVKRVFAHMHLFPTAICKADRAALGGDPTNWGTYYAYDPEVMVGRLREGAAILGRGVPR